MQGFGKFQEKLSFKRLVTLHQSYILLLQESLGLEDVVTIFLKSTFAQLDFIAQDARGHSGGLAIGWNPKNIQIKNSWGCVLGMGLEVYHAMLNTTFTILNVYGSYEEWVFVLGFAQT